MPTILANLTLRIPKLPTRPTGQLLKWVGNKFRYAYEIVSLFPTDYNVFYEPFVGTGAVLATLNPQKAIAGDTLKPLIELWKMVKEEPKKVSDYYEKEIRKYLDNLNYYTTVKNRYNNCPNGLDLLILSRTCYGGVIRFTKEGKISTPVGPHKPISSDSFKLRLAEWRERIINCEFFFSDYKQIIRQAGNNDLVYCDPPYKDSQTILYGAQSFKLEELFEEIAKAKTRGAKVALSIDGIKKSGEKNIKLGVPDGLFEREVFVECGHSMLRRFQKNGEKMNGEKVSERLLLTW